MKVVKCILKPSRIVVLKEEFTNLVPKMIKPNNDNNNNLYKDKETTDNCNMKINR